MAKGGFDNVHVPAPDGTGAVPSPLYRKLDTNGDGTGTTNAIGDYSSSSTSFYIQPPSGTVYRLERMLIFMRMTKANFKFDQYGKNQVLTNGIEVHLHNGVFTDLTDGIPIKRFGDWMRVCFDVQTVGGDINQDYNTDVIVGGRWTFSRAGFPLRIAGDNNERLEVNLNDDFATGTEIKEHYFFVQGYIERQ